jgi:hypothetical protein
MNVILEILEIQRTAQNLVRSIALSVQKTKAYTRSRGKAPLILNLGTKYRWMVSFIPRPL